MKLDIHHFDPNNLQRSITLSKGYYVQLLQPHPQDAAVVEMQWPGQSEWVKLFAGEILPLPIHSACGDSTSALYLFEEEQISPRAPLSIEIRVLCTSENKRVVLGIVERADAKDKWSNARTHHAGVAEMWTAPSLACPLIAAAAAGKNVAVVPCKGMRSGVWSLTSPSSAASYVVSVAEYYLTDPQTFASAILGVHHVVPVFVVTELLSGGYPKVQALPFRLSGRADYLLFRAWRYDDAVAATIPESKIHLSSIPLDNGQFKRCDSGSAQITGPTVRRAASVANLENAGRARALFSNDFGAAAIDQVDLLYVTNVNANDRLDRHDITDVVSGGPIAVNNSLQLTGNLGRFDCAVAQVDQTNAVLIVCSASVGLADN